MPVTFDDYNIQEKIPLKNPIYDEIQYRANTYKDKGFSIIFLLHLLFVIISGISGMMSNNDHDNNNYTNSTNNTKDTNSKINTEHADLYFLSTSIVTIILSYLILFAIKRAPNAFIYVANSLLIAFNFISAIYCFSQDLIFCGILFLLQGSLMGFWFYVAGSYIPFSKLLLKTTIGVMGDNKTIFLVPFFGLLFLCVYTIFMTFGIHYYSKKMGDDNNWGIFVLFISLFFWTQQVISNIIHVTVSGVIGNWYHWGVNVVRIVNPVWKSFVRAMTTNFGSICFGSLLVAVIQTLKFAVSLAKKNDNDFVVCCADCILSILDNLLQYFNTYAYSYVGIYGMSYIDSAKATWELSKRAFFTALFNDNLIYPVLQFSVLFIAVFTGLLIWIISADLYISLVSAIISFSIASIIMNLLHSAIIALFVCCAENFDILSQLHPEMHNELVLYRDEMARNNNII